MTVIREQMTYGDNGTYPGGFVIIDRGGDSIVHRYRVTNYNTDRRTGTKRGYWGGGYFDTLAEAETDFQRRYDRAAKWDTGGSLNRTGVFAANNPAFPAYAHTGDDDLD